MSVDILYNTIQPLEHRQSVEQAVIEAVGNRPGRWKAWLDQGDGEPGFSIRIGGPDGVGFSYRFLKPSQRSLASVQKKLEEGIRQFARVHVP